MNEIRIRYGEGETGWAECLGDNKYRLCNVPLSDGLNIDDIVVCEEKDEHGFLCVTDVVERKYHCKDTIQYETIEQYHLILDKIKKTGGKIEGWVAPKDGNPGLCTIAYNENMIDPQMLIDEIGIKIPQYFDDGPYPIQPSEN